jgi:hypothetical protein
LRYFERYETVPLPNGIKIYYLYDAQYNGTGHNKSISGAIASAVSTCGVVYKNELYDLSKGRQWTFEAPVFGVPFGAKHISIHIEHLPGHPGGVSPIFAIHGRRTTPTSGERFFGARAGEQARVAH